MKTIDPKIIGHYIRDASNIQKKLDSLKQYVDEQHVVLEELKNRYGVDDTNCSNSEKAKNPYGLSSRGARNFDIHSNKSGKTGNASDINQVLMPNEFPQAEIIDHKKIYVQLI